MVVDLGIWGWIILELIATVATVFIINWVMKKEYPWLRTVSIPTKILLQKYHTLIIKTKQIFIHKVGYFILQQTSPLIIYALVSLTMVTYYGNYLVIIGYTTTMMNAVFDGMAASVGSLVSENNKKHTMEVFWELFSSRVWISGCACFAIYVFMAPFIYLWIGEQYLLSNTTLLLMILIMFVRLTRTVTDNFNHAYQLFGDVWSPVVEGAINLGFSFWLGSIWGLEGILSGVLLSLLATALFWKPYYLFSRGFKTPTRFYYYHYFLLLLILGGTAWLALFLFKDIQIGSGIVAQIIRSAIALIFFITISFTILYALTKSMRQFTNRILRIVHLR